MSRAALPPSSRRGSTRAGGGCSATRWSSPRATRSPRSTPSARSRCCSSGSSRSARSRSGRDASGEVNIRAHCQGAKAMIRTTPLLVSMLLALPLLALLPRAAGAQPQAPKEDLVIARGDGLVKRVADRAFVTIAAESRSRQPKVAQEANATAMTAVLARLKGLGLADDAIRTLSYGVQPEYDWTDGKRSLRGYLARNVIEVRIDDVARVGEVVDTAVGSGATQVQNVRFTLK